MVVDGKVKCVLLVCLKVYICATKAKSQNFGFFRSFN